MVTLLCAYYACTTFADWNIGRVIEALDKSKYAKNTNVVFWSDNGYHCGAKNHWEKNTLWEQAASTLMAIKVPGAKSNGNDCTKSMNSVDLYPTLTELCGLNQKSKTDGKSLKPLIDHPDTKWKPAITAFGEGFISIRNEQYSYIRYSDGSEELYDHYADPHELNNIQDDPKSRKVKQKLVKYIPDKFATELPGRRN